MSAILPTLHERGVRLVVDHFGHPAAREGENSEGFRALLEAVSAGKTWIKLSAPYRLRGSDPHVLARRIIDVSNGERALWATDWPWVGHENRFTYRQCIEDLFEFVPDQYTRDRILTTNAYDAFGFQAP